MGRSASESVIFEWSSLKLVVPNLFLTVVQINVENFPLLISQIVIELQFSNILQSACDPLPPQKKRSTHQGMQFSAYFQAVSKKKSFRVWLSDPPPKKDTTSFCKLCDDVREKEVIAQIQLF